MHPGWTAFVIASALTWSVVGGWLVTSGILRLASRRRDVDADAPAPTVGPGTTAPQATLAASGTGTTGPTQAGVAPSVPTHPDGAPAAGAGGADVGPDSVGARAALRGGTWIGILERFAVTGALLVSEPGAIAVVVAVKGLGRYPELKDHPEASERFVIGTLASLTWAGMAGIVGRAILLG